MGFGLFYKRDVPARFAPEEGGGVGALFAWGESGGWDVVGIPNSPWGAHGVSEDLGLGAEQFVGELVCHFARVIKSDMQQVTRS